MAQDTPKLEYLLYAPKASNERDNYATFSDRMGFGADPRMRAQFSEDVRCHVNSLELRFLRKFDNKGVFKAMILGFLEEYGEVYWGLENRDHLCEKDPQRGFLRPRDAQRPESR